MDTSDTSLCTLTNTFRRCLVAWDWTFSQVDSGWALSWVYHQRTDCSIARHRLTVLGRLRLLLR